MKMQCKYHGEVEAQPNANYDVICPHCIHEAYKRFSQIEPMPHMSEVCRPGVISLMSKQIQAIVDPEITDAEETNE